MKDATIAVTKAELEESVKILLQMDKQIQIVTKGDANVTVVTIVTTSKSKILC